MGGISLMLWASNHLTESVGSNKVGEEIEDFDTEIETHQKVFASKVYRIQSIPTGARFKTFLRGLSRNISKT